MHSVEVKIVSIWSKPTASAPAPVYSVRVPTGDTDAVLEAAFALTNRDDRPMSNKVCSTSAGDLMILDGEHYMVSGHGFTPITPAQAETITKLTSRDTAMGLDWLIRNGKVGA